MAYHENPGNLAFAGEGDWMDGFLAWFANKRFSVVAVCTRRGEIVTRGDQNGFYLSLQGSY